MLAQEIKNRVTEYPYNLVVKQDGYCSIDHSQLDLDYIPSVSFTPIKQKIVDEDNFHPLEQVGKIYLDIETTGLDSKTDRVIFIGLRVVKESDDFDRYFIYQNRDNEGQLLFDFINQLNKIKSGLLIVHNGFNFDLPFIINRCEKYRISHGFRINSNSTIITSSSLNGNPIEINQVTRFNLQIIDTFCLAGIFDKSANVLPNLNLKTLALFLKVRDESRLDLSYDQIMTCWHNQQDDIIIEYLKFDLDDTKGLFDIFFPVYWLQSQIITNVSLQYLCISSPAFKWQKMIELVYGKTGKYDLIKSALPDEKLKYQGALTGINPGLYPDCFKIDISSMYPNIVMVYKLYPLKDIEGIYYQIMKEFISLRMKYKALYKSTKNKFYDNFQNALKILINGGYGYTGTGGYALNCMSTAALITAYGRQIITLMVKTLNRLRVKVIEVDTDGIICQSDRNSYEILSLVQQELPQGIDLDLDWNNTHVYAPKAKNYLLFHQDKIVRKGYFKKRNKSLLERDFAVEYVRLLLESSAKANSYFDDVYVSIYNRTIDINQISITQRIPKNSKSLLPLGKVGDKVNYYFCELQRFHKKTGKPIKSHFIPTNNKPYSIEYYLKLIVEIKSDIDLVSQGGIPGNISDVFYVNNNCN